MICSNQKVYKFAAAALVCALASCSLAHAQEGNGEVGGTVIIKGDGGTRTIHIDPSQLQGNAEGNSIVVVFSNGNGDLISFAGSPADLPFGGNLGPFGLAALMNAGGTGGLNIIDPGVSYIHQLIKRSDVRSDLFLATKQCEQLDQMESAESQAAQQRLNSIPRAGASGGTDPNITIQDRVKKLHELAGGMADDRDKKLAAILTPKQIKRLKELDLQFRGPLAMGVKPVAEKAKLTDVQAPVVVDLLTKYHDTVRKALGIDQKISRSQDANGSTSISVSSSASIGSPDEMKAKLEKAHDEIEQSRRKLGDQALKSLTDTQISEWRSLTGVRFQFQTLN